ncbi:MAG: SDR family oxidoreductase [Propylenella sp.]
MLERFSLEGKVALVTGSSRGLGWTMAEALASAGAHVVLNGRDQALLRQRAGEIETAGGRASIASFDVTDSRAATSAVDEIAAREGHVDVLVCNAGIVVRKPLVEVTDDEWHRVVDTDLSHCFYLARAAARHMILRKWGRIIATSSVMGTIARPTISSYVASKAGIHGLIRALAVELAPHGITANAIAPGFYPSEANEVIRNDKAFYDWVCRRTPMGRWGDPQELTGALIYFASDASSYCNGQVLTIDGGMTAAM